jgi:hypothetical protein
MIASAVLFTALETSGQPDGPTRVQLAFKAPGTCADSGEFERRVKQRSDRIAFVSEAPYTGTAKVTLEPTGDSVRVRLSWTREGDTATGREFKAASCGEALDAAALVIAISFDPSAPENPSEIGAGSPGDEPRESTTPEADEPSSPSGASEPPASGSTSAPPESRPLALPVTDAGAPDGHASEPSGSEASVVFGSSALIQGISGVAPVAMAGVGLSLELAIGAGWLAPQLRLEGMHYFGVTYPTDGGDARFELDSLEVFACPFRLGSERVSLRPCVALTGGRLVASGRDTVSPSSHTRPLWIVGGALALGIRPSSLLLVSADLSVGAPTARDSFQFAPDEFHQVSQVVVSASLGVGFEFR